MPKFSLVFFWKSEDYYPLGRQPNQKVPYKPFYQQFSIFLRYMMPIGGSQTLIARFRIIRETSSVKYWLRGAFKKINQMKRNLWLDIGHIKLLEHKISHWTGRIKKIVFLFWYWGVGQLCFLVQNPKNQVFLELF